MEFFIYYGTVATIEIPGISSKGMSWNIFFPKCFVVFISAFFQNLPFSCTCKSLKPLCVYVFVHLPGCLLAARAIAWCLPWHWVVPLTIAALPATCLVPVMPLEALLTGDRSPCLSSKKKGGDCVCLSLSLFGPVTFMQIIGTLQQDDKSETADIVLLHCFFFFFYLI